MFFNKKKEITPEERRININEELNNYGGFIVSNNVIKGRPIRYTFREKPSMPNLNGWTIYSCDDDQQYVENPKNFTILGGESIRKISPVILEIFDAPYGTDLCWMYDKKGNFTNFYDLKNDKDTTLEEILNRNSIS